MATPATRSHPSSSSSPVSTAGVEAKPVLVDTPGSMHTLNGKGLKIAIVFSRWYGKEVVHPLVEACKNELLAKGVSSSDVICVEVSGAFEIPFAAGRLIQTKREKLDAVVCIGCMVKGATMAYEFVSEAVAMAVMKLNVMTDTPVIFGVLTCGNEAQAKQCAADTGGCASGSRGEAAATKKCNHGVEWAQSALEMAHLKRCTAAKVATKCKCKCHCASKSCNCSCHCDKCKCKACTCGGDCECASCASDKKLQHPKMSEKGAAASGCTGCGKAGANCNCVGCNCSACGSRSAKAKSP